MTYLKVFLLLFSREMSQYNLIPHRVRRTLKAINIILNIYLLGGSITFCDGIPVTTAATNSGVTFEEKLDAMNLIIDFFLVSFSKSTKAKLNSTAASSM